MQAPSGRTLKEELVELLIARRFQPLVVARAQPAVLRGAMHCAEHVSRAKRGDASEPMAMSRVVEARDVKRCIVSDDAHSGCARGAYQCKELVHLWRNRACCV